MEEKINEILNKITFRRVKMEDELLQSGILDSFKIMDLISQLERVFQIEFLPDEITEMENFESGKNIVRCVAKKLNI